MKKNLKILLALIVLSMCVILFSASVKAANEPTITMDVDGNFFVGITKEYTVTTRGNSSEMVVGTFSIDDPDAVEKLEYLEEKNGKWYELKGDFGPAQGFPFTDGATSSFKLTFKKAGTYTISFSVVKATNKSEVVAKNTLQVKVEEPTVSMAVGGNFYVGQEQEFSMVTTKPEGYPDVKIIGKSTFVDENGKDAMNSLKSLYYKEGEEWIDLIAIGIPFFGPEEGFSLGNSSSTFKATFKKAGTYTLTYGIETADTHTVLAQDTLKIKVLDTVDNQIQNSKEDVIDVSASSKQAISKEVLNQLKNGAEKDINIHLDNGITLSFNTKNIKEEFKNDLSLDITVTEDQPFEEKLQGFDHAELLYVDIAYSGVLPKDTQITFNVGDLYKAGDKVYLYYYNPETKKAELISNNIVIHENGNATISIDHASTYFLSKTALETDDPAVTESTNNEPNVATGDRTIFVAVILIVVATIGIIFVAKKRKE